MSPQEAHRLVGHTPAQKEDIVERIRAAGRSRASYLSWMEYDEAADEIERLRCALRAVRASTDPRWQAQLIAEALREV